MDARRPYLCDRMGISLPDTPPWQRPQASTRIGTLAHRGPSRAHGTLPASGRKLQGPSTRHRPSGPTPVGAARTRPNRLASVQKDGDACLVLEAFAQMPAEFRALATDHDEPGSRSVWMLAGAATEVCRAGRCPCGRTGMAVVHP